MLIEKVKLKGFISFIDDEVDFRKSHITLVFGQNGKGKSALLESIPFCFWGAGRGKTIADYINDKCSTLYISVIFIMDSVRYKKVRQCGSAGNVNELYVDQNSNERPLEDAKWKLITDDTKKSTDVELSKILGLNYDIFSNSVFFGQKEASSFIEGGASDRKELLCNLLGIQVYEDAEEVAKEKLKELDIKIQTKTVVLNDKLELIKKKDQVSQDLIQAEKKLQTANADIKQLNEQIETLRDKQEKLKIEAAGVEKNKEKRAELDKQLVDAAALKKQTEDDLWKAKKDLEATIDEGIEKVEELKVIIDSKVELLDIQAKCKIQLEQIAAEKTKITALKEKLIEKRANKDVLIQKESEITTQIEALESKKKKISKTGAICPIIEQPCEKLSEGNKKSMVDELDADVQKRNKTLQQCKKDLLYIKELIVADDGQLEAIAKRIESEPKVTARLSSAESDLKIVSEATEKLPVAKKKYRKKVDDITATVENLEKRLKKVVGDYEQLKQKKEEADKMPVRDFDAEISRAKQQAKIIQLDINTVSKDKENVTLNIGQYKSELEKMQQAEKDAEKIKSDIDAVKEDVRVNTELAFSFGKNGIPKDIISTNVPVLEENANILLNRFTKSNEFNIKFDLDPKTQSGKFKKQGGLDIIVYRKGGIPRPLHMYSGGETVRIVFAILLSLSSLLTKRAGKRSQTLIVDERIAALDVEGINQFVEIVKYISDKYKKILIVSHISELNEAFPNVITVDKDDTEGSKVSYQLA